MIKWLFAIFIWTGENPVDVSLFPQVFDSREECTAKADEVTSVVDPPQGTTFTIECVELKVPAKPAGEPEMQTLPPGSTNRE